MSIAPEQVGERGVKEFGVHWLEANETACNIAAKIGVAATKHRDAMQAAVLGALIYYRERIAKQDSVDAARYRWLRGDGLSRINWEGFTSDTSDIGLDHAIDAAIKAKGEQQ